MRKADRRRCAGRRAVHVPEFRCRLPAVVRGGAGELRHVRHATDAAQHGPARRRRVAISPGVQLQLVRAILRLSGH